MGKICVFLGNNYDFMHALATPKLSLENIRNIKVPKIEKNIQEKIVAEILPLEETSKGNRRNTYKKNKLF